MTYIATFYSHFGAVRFKRCCADRHWDAHMMPVPRDLSSSCGTCVQYESNSICPIETIPEEIEQIVEVTDAGYMQCYLAADS